MALEKLSDLVRNGRWRSVLLSAVVLDVVALTLFQRFLGGGPAAAETKAEGSRTKALKEREEEGLESVKLQDPKNGPLVLAVDCDGTLFNDVGEVSERSLKALRRFASRGGTVVLATGHPPMAIKKTAELVGCNAFVICSSGAVVMGAKHWEPKIENTVPRECVTRIVHAIQRISPEIEVAVEAVEHWYVQTNNFFEELDKSIPGAKVGSRIAGLGICAGDYPLHEYFAESGEGCAVRVLAIHPTWSAEELMVKVADLVEEEVSLYSSDIEVKHSGAPRGIHIGCKNVHKAHALEQVCELLNVPASRVVAFGDNMNDLEMLSWAGKGIAVGNAVDELKKVADKVSKFTNAEDSVAREMEEILANSDPCAMMRDNLRRLTDQIDSMESRATELARENDELQGVVDKHENFLDLLKSQTPAPFQSPSRKRYMARSPRMGSTGTASVVSFSSFA